MAKTEKPSKFTIFETTCRQMEQQGYHQKSLIISARKLNLISILLIVPIIAVPLLLYLLRWGFFSGNFVAIQFAGWFLPALILSIFVHELIHGITRSLFCKDGFHSIHFGFQLKTLTPYCHCAQPLQKGAYLIGTLMPCLILGVGAIVLSMLFPFPDLVLFGAVNIALAVGDLAIALLLLPQKEVLVVDHPTEPGLIAFTR